MDELDRALMEALNESVPPANLSSNFADRLLARTHRRARFWKLLLVAGMFTAAVGAVITATSLLRDDSRLEIDERRMTNDKSSGEAIHGADADSENRHPGGDETSISTPQQGSTQVNNTIRKATAIMSALAISAAPRLAAAGDYQFIVSGYPVANPSHSAVSSSMPLVVGMLASASTPSSLEARCRTHDYSLGTSLRSDEYRAMIIIFR